MEIKFLAPDKKACLKKLEAIKAQLEALEELMGEKPVLYGEERKRAQELLKTLKGTLRAEYRRTHMPSARNLLNTTEEHHYGPAIQQADCAIRVKYNSIPNEQWFSEIYNARDTIEWFISGLKNGKPRAKREGR